MPQKTRQVLSGIRIAFVTNACHKLYNSTDLCVYGDGLLNVYNQSYTLLSIIPLTPITGRLNRNTLIMPYKTANEFTEAP
jgi:hypothetical protein